MPGPVIELDADTYDAMEFGCLVSGGISYGSVYDPSGCFFTPRAQQLPGCFWGHLDFIGRISPTRTPEQYGWHGRHPEAAYTTTQWLSPESRRLVPLGGLDADNIVRRLLGERGWLFGERRIPWKQFCEAANIVRKPHPNEATRTPRARTTSRQKRT